MDDSSELTQCPDCSADPGSPHEDGCDVEPCPDCGHQMISCGCEDEVRHPRLTWSGRWPGEAECVEFGWYSRFVVSRGWVRCNPDDPDAGPDLNRLHAEARWDAERGRFVLPDRGA